MVKITKGKPGGSRPPITPSRPRRVVRFVLRKNSEADGVIADWIDELQKLGMEHSAAIRNILRAAISGHPFVTPLAHIHYVSQSAPTSLGPGTAAAKTGITDADITLLQQLRKQMGGKP